MSKKIVTIGIAIVLACVVFVGVCANLSFVSAETLSDEAYTSSDHLLNANGTTETKTIQDFAEEVKAAANNDEVSDLEKVIPTKYLNSSTDITVNYCGAEYGLYTYEEFSQLVPVSQQVFEAFNGSYLKIAVGKGMIDTETLIALAERYSAYLN